MIRNLNLMLFVAGLIAMSLPSLCAAQSGLRIPYSDAGVFDPNEGPIRFDYRLLKDAREVEILVIDFRGQVVERLAFVELTAGDHAFEWSGRDENNENLPKGGYRFEFRVTFEDGLEEEGAMEVRIAAKPEKRVMPPPDLLPREEPYHLIDGSISTYWRRNSEDPEEVQRMNEQRVWTRLRLRGEGHRAEGVFSMRRPHGGSPTYEGSSAMAEKNWEDGRLRGVFRQGLGNFDDPMKLFSDFRTERKKTGVRVDHDFGRAEVSLLGFAAEGNIDGNEQGGAFRLGLEGPWKTRAGITLTGRRSLPEEGDSRTRERAGAMDLAVPLHETTELQFQAVATRDSSGVGDTGSLVRIEHDSGNLRASAGYYDLGEGFSAPFSDPIRRVSSDARGVVAGVDVLHPKTLWAFSSVACSFRGFSLKRWSSGESLREGDASLRLRLAKSDSILFRWLGREEGEQRTNTLMGTGRHAWNDTWSSSLQINTTSSAFSKTWRWRVDTSYQKDGRLFRVALERVRRVIETSSDSPYIETGLQLDGNMEPFSAQISARKNRRGNESGVNLFGRVSFEPELLHRYRVNTYLALGNRAAFKTEKQIEMGLEMKF